MKKTFMGILGVLMVMFVGSGLGLAANGSGYGGGGHHGGNGSGSYHGGGGSGYHGGGNGGYHGGGATGTPYICEYGEDATVTGVVISVNLWGAGMVVALDEENTATVYGLGPWWYWDAQGIALPSVGDSVTVKIKHVEINGTERDVAMSITNDTTTKSISLRDPETCYPYWSGGR